MYELQSRPQELKASEELVAAHDSIRHYLTERGELGLTVYRDERQDIFQLIGKEPGYEGRDEIEPHISTILEHLRVALLGLGWHLDADNIAVNGDWVAARETRNEEDDLEQWHADTTKMGSDDFVFISFGGYPIETFAGDIKIPKKPRDVDSDHDEESDGAQDLEIKNATEAALAKGSGIARKVPYGTPVLLTNYAVHRAGFPTKDGFRLSVRATVDPIEQMKT